MTDDKGDGLRWVTDDKGDGLRWVTDDKGDGLRWVTDDKGDGLRWVADDKGDGLRWVTDDKGDTYLTLYQSLSMKDDLTPSATLRKYPKGVPYDYSNPAVKEETIRKRICKSCGLYFGAINAKESHQRTCSPVNVSLSHDHGEQNEDPGVRKEQVRVRPVRVKARRVVELLCMENNELDWYDFDEMDVAVDDGRPVLNGTLHRSNLERGGTSG